MPHFKLSPAKIDARARAYRALCARLEPIEKQIARDKAQLITLCRHFGHSPLGAEKTLRLEGVEWLIDAAFGQSASIDEAIVDEIQKRFGKFVYALLFERRFTHTIRPLAAERLSDAKKRLGLTAGRARRLRDLFAKVQVVTPRAPTLNVKPRTAKVLAGRRPQGPSTVDRRPSTRRSK